MTLPFPSFEPHPPRHCSCPAAEPVPARSCSCLLSSSLHSGPPHPPPSCCPSRSSHEFFCLKSTNSLSSVFPSLLPGLTLPPTHLPTNLSVLNSYLLFAARSFPPYFPSAYLHFCTLVLSFRFLSPSSPPCPAYHPVLWSSPSVSLLAPRPLSHLSSSPSLLPCTPSPGPRSANTLLPLYCARKMLSLTLLAPLSLSPSSFHSLSDSLSLPVHLPLSVFLNCSRRLCTSIIKMSYVGGLMRYLAIISSVCFLRPRSFTPPLLLPLLSLPHDSFLPPPCLHPLLVHHPTFFTTLHLLFPSVRMQKLRLLGEG